MTPKEDYKRSNLFIYMRKFFKRKSKRYPGSTNRRKQQQRGSSGRGEAQLSQQRSQVQLAQKARSPEVQKSRSPEV